MPVCTSLYRKAGFAQALDAVRVIGWILEWQYAPPPLDRKIRSNSHELCPSRATLIDVAKVAVAGCEESVSRLRFRIALEAPLESFHSRFELPQRMLRLSDKMQC